MKNSNRHIVIRSTQGFLAMLVLILSADLSVADEYFNAYETVRDAGVGTYGDDSEYDAGEEGGQTATGDNYGTEYLYLDGKQCFVMRSAAGTIVTCD